MTLRPMASQREALDPARPPVHRPGQQHERERNQERPQAWGEQADDPGELPVRAGAARRERVRLVAAVAVRAVEEEQRVAHDRGVGGDPQEPDEDRRDEEHQAEALDRPAPAQRRRRAALGAPEDPRGQRGEHGGAVGNGLVERRDRERERDSGAGDPPAPAAVPEQREEADRADQERRADTLAHTGARVEEQHRVEGHEEGEGPAQPAGEAQPARRDQQDDRRGSAADRAREGRCCAACDHVLPDRVQRRTRQVEQRRQRHPNEADVRQLGIGAVEHEQRARGPVERVAPPEAARGHPYAERELRGEDDHEDRRRAVDARRREHAGPRRPRQRAGAHVGSSARCSPCSVLCQWCGRRISSPSAIYVAALMSTQ